MKLVEWLSRLGLSDRIVIVVAAVVYATMVLLMLWFWSVHRDLTALVATRASKNRAHKKVIAPNQIRLIEGRLGGGPATAVHANKAAPAQLRSSRDPDLAS